MEEWTLASFKGKFGPWRLFCCEDTASSSMNYSVFFRNRVMFNASIQISLPTESPHDVLCVNACFFLNIIRCKRSIYFHSHITFISRFVQDKKKNQFVSFFSHKRKQQVLAVVPGRSVTAVARLPADFLTNLAL